MCTATMTESATPPATSPNTHLTHINSTYTDSTHTDSDAVSHPRVSLIKPSNLPDLKTFFFAIVSVIIVWLPVLLLHLTLVMFSGLVVYALTRGIANIIRKQTPRFLPRLGKAMAVKQRAESVGIVVVMVLLFLGIYIFGDWVADKASVEHFNNLFNQIMLVIEQLHRYLPDSMSRHLPVSTASFKTMLMDIVKNHASQLQLAGIHTIRGLGYVLIGAVIGGIVAIQVPADANTHTKPLTRHFRQKFDELMTGFSDVFFAQVKISTINTILTSIYLLGILPAIGQPLPMAWTVVLITFVAGLFPVIGNLVSNTVIVLLSLTHGLAVSVMSLIWLMGIHKLEYFLNAQIIGHKIRATAWELLLFMLVLESTFGMAGLVSAPIIYAQIKRILTDRGWV
ncbi:MULTISPECIES: AI-2E family transporter [unclassified Moraxella]|uniref:AI-2E family transporter n=1 Tax=unclassified Moraxella TaxID=2685852 RepID=UPI003AF53817